MEELNPFVNPIEIKCEGAATLPLEDLLDFQGGLKKLSEENRKKLIKSICTEGFMAPIFVWNDSGNYRILDGHGRLNALKNMKQRGWEIPELPIVWIEAENETEARRKLLKITSQFGEFDMEELTDWINDLDAEITEEIRLVDQQLELALDTSQLEETAGDDEVSDVEETISKLGDIWDLGPHKLICADSTKPEQIEPLFADGRKADILVTDPPYNIAYEGGSKKREMIENDKMEDSNFREFLKDAYSTADTFMKPGAVFYIWHADSEGYNFRGAARDVGWNVRQTLIWNKNNSAFGRSDYHWKHEPALYGWKEGSGHLWNADRKQTTVLDFDRPAVSEVHPTMKPVPLIAYCIQNNTKEEDIILDLFGGSGTAIIAAEKTNRIARVSEFDPHYVDVEVARYKKWCEDNGRECVIKLNGEVWDG